MAVLSFIQGKILRVWNIFLLHFCLPFDQTLLDRGPDDEAARRVVFVPHRLPGPACAGWALQLAPRAVGESVEG